MSTTLDLLNHSVSIETPTPWRQFVDDTIPNLPLTLVNALEEHGVLQFSVWLYTGGKKPELTPEDLLGACKDDAARTGAGPSSDEVMEASEALLLGAATFHHEGLVRVWWVSDGWSLARVTYTGGDEPLYHAELKEAEAIVRSLRFIPQPAAQAA